MAIITLNNNSLSSVTALPAAIPTGKVLQVKQTHKADTFGTNSTSFTDVTGLNVSITPSSSSNKILVVIDLQVGSRNDSQCMFRLLRGTTHINKGDASGSRTQCFNETQSGENYGQSSSSTVFLDTPATTSATNYKVQMRATGATHYLNQSNTDVSATYEARTTSSITVYEIAG